MRPEIRRRILIIFVAAVVIISVVYGFMPKPIPVDVAEAIRGPMKVTVDEEGKARVRDRFVISAPVSGFLRRIELQVGDDVKKGMTVAVLEPLRSGVLDPRSRAEAIAAVSSAQAALNAAKENALSAGAASEYAQKNLERQSKLFESGFIAKDTLDQALAEFKRTEALLLSAESAVNVARSELERTQSSLGHSAADGVADRERIVLIRAPSGGSVIKMHQESEGVVAAGAPLIDIGDPAKLEVKVEVLSADAINIKQGTPVIFERWGGDSALSGLVRVVEPAAFTKISSLGVEEQRVLVIADITSLPESWKRLGDGYRVEANFVVWEADNVLQVPASSLFRKGEGWAVFVFDNNRARLKEVKIGRRNGLSAEIISGLSDKEIVITHPDETIRDSSRIKLRKT